MKVIIHIEADSISIDLVPFNKLEREVLKSLPPQLDVFKSGDRENGDFQITLATEDRSKIEPLTKGKDENGPTADNDSTPFRTALR